MEEEKPGIIEFNVFHDARLFTNTLYRVFVGNSVVDSIYRVVGNIYKKVKGPNMVGALNDHKERYRVFARYGMSKTT